MFWKKSNTEKRVAIDWQKLTTIEQLQSLKEESKTQPVLIFKHSIRCSISSMALSRLEREWSEELNKITPYYLDLITYRQVSNAVETEFGVYHESPQMIVLNGGEVVFDASHMSISTEPLKKWA